MRKYSKINSNKKRAKNRLSGLSDAFNSDYFSAFSAETPRKKLAKNRRGKSLRPRRVNRSKETYLVPYDPWPEMVPFHRARGFSGVRCVLGGVGSGKTTAGAAESLRLNLANDLPGLDGMIVAPTYPLLHRVTLRAFLKVAGPLPRRHNREQRFFEMPGGSRVYYGSADRPDTLEGSNLTWTWLDELRYFRRSAFDICLARVRVPQKDGRAGHIFATTTPSKGWLKEVFGPAALIEHPDRYALSISTRVNRSLPPEFLSRMLGAYSARQFEEYVEGLWVPSDTAVFPSFDEPNHVETDLHVPGYPVDFAYDPGFNRPAGLFLQKFEDRCCPRHPNNQGTCVHVLGEYLPEKTSTLQAVPQVVEVFRGKLYSPGVCVLDPAGRGKSPELGRSSVSIFEASPLWRPRGLYDSGVTTPTSPGQRSIRAGVESVRALISPVVGPPRIYFDASIAGPNANPRGIVRALEAYETKAGSDDPIKDGVFDHVIDALRYYVVLYAPIPGIESGVKVFY